MVSAQSVEIVGAVHLSALIAWTLAMTGTQQMATVAAVAALWKRDTRAEKSRGRPRMFARSVVTYQDGWMRRGTFVQTTQFSRHAMQVLNPPTQSFLAGA